MSYRGDVMVLVINHGDYAVSFEKGDRIAQMVIQKVEPAEFAEVEDLDETERGEGGFGSTGK